MLAGSATPVSRNLTFLLDLQTVRFTTSYQEKDLNRGYGEENLLSVFSSPLSKEAQGLLPRERKGTLMNPLTQLKNQAPKIHVCQRPGCTGFETPI